MAGQITGNSGEVQIAAATVDGIKNWTVDYVVDVLDATALADSGRRTYIAVISGWSGNFEGYKDSAPTGIGSLVALILEESTDPTEKYTGQAILTGLHETVSVDGVVGISYDFQGIGALTPPHYGFPYTFPFAFDE